jgi:hypothetical protein
VPRGSAGRYPGTWQLDFHAEYAFKIWKTDLAFFMDMFNVTNRQTATGIYQTAYYTPDTFNEVYSGQMTPDPNWGKTTGRQAPREVRLGVKWSF